MASHIVLLGLGDATQHTLIIDLYTALISQISSKYATTSILNNAPDALQAIQRSNPPPVILAIDGGISKPSYTNFHRRLAKYVKEDGGTVIFGMLFSNFVRPRDVGALFSAFGLEWELGDYHRSNFVLNSDSMVVREDLLGDHVAAADSGVEQSYSMKAVNLDGVPNDAKVYVPTAESRVESLVFPPRPVEGEGCPAVFARCGKGRIGFVGDVNNEVGSQKLIMAMLGKRLLRP